MVISSRSSGVTHVTTANTVTRGRQSAPALKTAKTSAHSAGNAGLNSQAFGNLLSFSTQQTLRTLGLIPASTQTSLPSTQTTAAPAALGQNLVTQAALTSPVGSTAASAPASSSGAANPYRTDVGVYNPTQYATDATAQGLASLLGGTVMKTAATSGPFSIPQQNMLSFGNGLVANAGLVAQMVQMFGPDMASRMLADQAHSEAGAGVGQNPSMA